MGNFSSCTSGLGSTASPGAASLPHSSAVTRVLLVDGSVLKFRVPIKVIRLLLDYPHHVICPLDSLRPGLHSLSSLLPEEELQLGRLYLLLPFKSYGNRQKKATGRGKDEGLLPAKECGECTSLLVRNKSEVGYSASSDNHGKDSDVVYDNHGKDSDVVYHDSDINSKKRRSTESLGKEKNSSLHNSLACNSRLCDTPELQKAYRSVMLRRCRSWTPRLQPIKESKRACAGADS